MDNQIMTITLSQYENCYLPNLIFIFKKYLSSCTMEFHVINVVVF